MTIKAKVFTHQDWQYRAVIQAVGQLQDICGFATVGQVAKFLEVSKPTAQRVIDTLMDNNVIYECPRSGKCRRFILFEEHYEYYVHGDCLRDYRKWIDLLWSIHYGK